MSIGRRVLNLMNTGLVEINLGVDSLTAKSLELNRIGDAAGRGEFDSPVYPVPHSFKTADYRNVLSNLRDFATRLATFRDAGNNDVGFTYENDYYSSPDAEVLYAMVRAYEPENILEIGCGNSTRIIRQALIDGRFRCRHYCIDPEPRIEIVGKADHVIRRRIETLEPEGLADQLAAKGMLFIDASHEVKPANDTAFIYGKLLPILPEGTLVHIHDIFLPYEYPISWVRDGYDWGEQYIVQAMLWCGTTWRVLWPGYYLQRTQADFGTWFPHMAGGRAQSLWLQKISG